MLNFLLTQPHLNSELISSSVCSKSVEMQFAFPDNTTHNSLKRQHSQGRVGFQGNTQGGPKGNVGKSWRQTFCNL